ncbi:MAG: lipopolysaccharide heptosyltransferase II [Candidatus Scalindua rubra]|uniref:lipopolysaccharide heptosyltransferase II n=1 Tax=Candidatus Scalindua brodae TaxID=237368 RepID=A0A0B0EKJ8_9BACT|nr:MAG: ADP-heptose--LPS heptosyltransferase [Candidatus Scalindua brodae]MBZ0107154.1 lipopolysaccharide heptosyltransferase II [Candidatus Scalindua rubra]TWU38077.1 ADP-heptose--LPS heptosyltransferase 2 [Candidatus Brocadiaceae bacterium S225]
MEQLNRAKKILVRAPNWVGDVVMATPAFRCIRENFADSHITLLIKRNLRGIIDGSPWFDEVIELEPEAGKSKNGFVFPWKVCSGDTKAYLSLIHKIRIEKFDLGFLFPNSFSSSLMIWLGGVKRRVGYKRDARSFLLTDSIERVSGNGKFLPTYMGDYYLKLCSQLGCRIASGKPELFISEECEWTAKELLKRYNIDKKPYILMNPGASYGSSKLWTAEGFARTADLLKGVIDCNIVLTSGPGETDLADEIEKHSKSGLINLSRASISLDIFKVIVERCMLLIALDSGPRHYAVALNRPVVVLMGPNNPMYTESGYETGKVIREDIECSPCQLKTCPADRRCMTMITPEKVVKTCIEVLSLQKNEHGNATTKSFH